MYKVRKIKESELKEYTGKIISVIDTKKVTIPSYDYLGRRPWYECKQELELTCLVEE